MYEKRGYPLKLLKEGVRERFLMALEKGASYQISCGYAGIAYQTLRTWIIRAEGLLDLSPDELENHPDKIYVDFYYDLRRVEAEAAFQWLDKVDKAADVHWQAAAWKLERRFPKDYGRVEKDTKDDRQDDLIQKAKEEVTRLKELSDGSTPTAST